MLIRHPSYHLVIGFPVQTPLEGIESERAEHVISLAGTLGDGDNFLPNEVLIDLGFAQAQAAVSPALEEGADVLAYEDLTLGLSMIEPRDLNEDNLGCPLYFLL